MRGPLSKDSKEAREGGVDVLGKSTPGRRSSQYKGSEAEEAAAGTAWGPAVTRAE